MIPSAAALGLSRTLEFSGAPPGQTFYYHKRRDELHGGHLPVIESRWEDPVRFRKTEGPFIYAVVDAAGAVRYIGKSFEKFLQQRWLRPQPYIHHKSTRDRILAELNAERGPLNLWSSTAAEMKQRIPHHSALPDRTFIAGLEALWLQRWRPIPGCLWNEKNETLIPGFDDLEYWKAVEPEQAATRGPSHPTATR